MQSIQDTTGTTQGSWSLAELVAWLHELGDVRGHAVQVGRVLARRRIDWESVRAYVRLPREGYTRTLVARTPSFEVLVLTWSAKAVSPVHDHGAQACWMTPVLGVLEATTWRRVGGLHRPGPAKLEPEGPPRLLLPGAVEAAPPGIERLHAVGTAPGTGLAVSVHVYARPVTVSRVYDVVTGTLSNKRMRDDAVGPVGGAERYPKRSTPRRRSSPVRSAEPVPPHGQGRQPKRPGWLSRLFRRPRYLVPTAPRPDVQAKLGVSGVDHLYGNDVVALRDVSLDVHSGEFVCLLGPSGCGKTTLLYALAGHISPTGGQVTLDDVPITGPGPDRLLMFQEAALYPWMTVQQNITFMLQGRGMSRAERNERARSFLHWVQLDGFEHAMPHQLSGGMKMRVSLARALAVDAPVLLMDEPFASLDAQTREVMHRLLISVWRKTRKTVVFVTHDVTEALVLASRLVVMAPRPGRIVRDVELRLESERRPEDPALQALARQVRAMLREAEAESAPGSSREGRDGWLDS